MPPKQKAVKMDLNTFLHDETLGGSWADDDVDFNTIEIPSKKTGAFGATGIPSGGANPMDPAFGGHDSGPKREFTEYPIPDAPPYRARFNNLPWDATEESIGEYAESCADEGGSVDRVSAPKDMNDPTRLRGFAFVTYVTRENLENALNCNGQEMNGRRVYIAVAAPEKGGSNLNWGSARGSAYGSRGGDDFERKPRREEPNLDWGSARGSGVLPPREPREYREPREPREDRPKREEPVLNWGSARGSGVLPPREPREHREPREPREDRPKKEEPVLDWSSARSNAAPVFKTERKTTSNKKQDTEPWARGSQLPARASGASAGKRNVSQKKEESSKPVAQKSAFAVLAGEDDDEDDEEEELVEKTEQLSV